MGKNRRRQSLSITLESRALNGLERHASSQMTSVSRAVERSVYFAFTLAPHMTGWIDALRSGELDDATRADMLARMESALHAFDGAL